MTENNKNPLRPLYHRAVKLWQKFCVEHTALLDASFDEYALLLSSDIDPLESKILEKNEIIERIGILEKERQKLIESVSQVIFAGEKKEIKGMADFLKVMKKYEETGEDAKHLEKFNNLLVDIIVKIQEQNKKNQLFINKAITSLQDIREGAMGRPSYATYNAKGQQGR